MDAETGAEQIRAILERYDVASETDLDQKQINLRGAQLDFAERHAQAVFDREIGGFYDRVIAQDRAYAWLGWASPAVALDATSAALAGTDFAHHRDFIDAAERYRRDLVNRMNADLIPHPAVNGRERVNDLRLWSEVPEFIYQRPSVTHGVRSAGPAAAALGGWLLAALGYFVIAAGRLRP